MASSSSSKYSVRAIKVAATDAQYSRSSHEEIGSARKDPISYLPFVILSRDPATCVPARKTPSWPVRRLPQGPCAGTCSATCSSYSTPRSANVAGNFGGKGAGTSVARGMESSHQRYLVALRKEGRHAGRSARIEVDARVSGQSARQGLATWRASHLKSSFDTEPTIRSNDPSADLYTITRHRGAHVIHFTTHRRHPATKFQALVDGDTESGRVGPGCAVEPGQIDSVVDVSIGVDVRRQHVQRNDVRAREVPVVSGAHVPPRGSRCHACIGPLASESYRRGHTPVLVLP